MTSNRIFVRDDRETEVEVDYHTEGGSDASGLSGPPEDYDPGSAPEVIIEDCWIERTDGEGAAYTETVTLTDAERERFETEVLEDPATYELDEPDYD